MERIVFASEWFCEIGIALPVGMEIAVIEAGETVEFRPAVSGESTMLQRIAIRMPDPIGGRNRSSGEVPFAGWITHLPLGFQCGNWTKVRYSAGS
jgi:hypothetical protein